MIVMIRLSVFGIGKRERYIRCLLLYMSKIRRKYNLNMDSFLLNDLDRILTGVSKLKHA